MTTFTAAKGKISIQTTLTNAQLSKFNKLTDKMIVIDGAAYLPLEELHGVLFTNSRKNAMALVNNHNDVIKNHLVRDKLKFGKFFVSTAIRPMGIYQLLETLAKEIPSKANLYRESIFLLSYIVSKHPQLSFDSKLESQELNAKLQAAIKALKKRHNRCQLSDRPFQPDEEKHVHHIEAQALHPALAAEPSNLVVINQYIHDSYHHWLSKAGHTASRKSLIKYAQANGYKTSDLEAA
jgi:hypothetical protein